MAFEAVQAEAFRADTLLAFVIRRLTLIVRDDARTTSETIEEIRAVLFDHGLSDALGIPRSSLCMRTAGNPIRAILDSAKWSRKLSLRLISIVGLTLVFETAGC